MVRLRRASVGRELDIAGGWWCWRGWRRCGLDECRAAPKGSRGTAESWPRCPSSLRSCMNPAKPRDCTQSQRSESVGRGPHKRAARERCVCVCGGAKRVVSDAQRAHTNAPPPPQKNEQRAPTLTSHRSGPHLIPRRRRESKRGHASSTTKKRWGWHGSDKLRRGKQRRVRSTPSCSGDERSARHAPLSGCVIKGEDS